MLQSVKVKIVLSSTAILLLLCTVLMCQAAHPAVAQDPNPSCTTIVKPTETTSTGTYDTSTKAEVALQQSPRVACKQCPTDDTSMAYTGQSYDFTDTLKQTQTVSVSLSLESLFHYLKTFQSSPGKTNEYDETKEYKGTLPSGTLTAGQHHYDWVIHYTKNEAETRTDASGSSATRNTTTPTWAVSSGDCDYSQTLDACDPNNPKGNPCPAM